MKLEPPLLPFTEEARTYVEEKGYGLDDIIADESVRSSAENRVLAALDPALDDGRSQATETEVLSYPIARAIVSCVGEGLLTDRFASSEAERVKKAVSDEKAAGEHLGEMGYGVSGNRMSVGDYLTLSSGLPGEVWRLVNRRVKGGEVSLKRGDSLELLGEGARQRIAEKLPLDVPEEVCRELAPEISAVEEKLAEEGQVAAEDLELDRDCFPPCIDYLVDRVERGEGLTHTARFALTSFLGTVGLSVDEIVEVFSQAPDFDEERTRYQIEHISGEGGTEYTPPSCVTMKTYRNCPDGDSKCEAETVSHPLSYYRWELKDRDSGE